jgi:hypothetical protein
MQKKNYIDEEDAAQGEKFYSGNWKWKNGRWENVRECMEIRVDKEICRKMQENASRQSGMHLERAFRAVCQKLIPSNKRSPSMRYSLPIFIYNTSLYG